MEQNLDRSYDGKLSKVENLTWLPWVGKKFTKSKYKVLLVGESHYADAKDEAQKIIDVEKALNNKDFTRLCIHEAAIDESWIRNPPTLTNIKRLLLGKSTCHDEVREELWKEVAFYNFIQSVMDTKNHRPVDVSYYDSWSTFVKIVEILKPTHCIFLGVSASNTFNQAMNAMKKKHEGVEWVEKVGNTFGRKGAILDDTVSTDIVFVKHTGKFFSWPKWHNFLLKTCAAPINYLKSAVEK